MWTPGNTRRELDEIRRHADALSHKYPEMKRFLDLNNLALPYEFRDSTASYEEASTDPLVISPTEGPLENEATVRPFEKRTTLEPVEAESTPKPVNENFWVPIETFPTVRSVDFDVPEYNQKFEIEQPAASPLPFSSAAKVIGGTVGGFLTLVIIAVTVATLLDRKNPARRSILRGVRSYGAAVGTGAGAADQEMLMDRTPPDDPSSGGLILAPGPFNADLPPSYNECAPYGINNSVAEEPPPYPYLEPPEYNPGHMGFIVNELRACSADVAPEIRTNHGRIEVRMGLDLNRHDNGTGAASNVETTRYDDLKGRVVYVDEINLFRK